MEKVRRELVNGIMQRLLGDRVASLVRQPRFCVCKGPKEKWLELLRRICQAACRGKCRELWFERCPDKDHVQHT